MILLNYVSVSVCGIQPDRCVRALVERGEHRLQLLTGAVHALLPRSAVWRAGVGCTMQDSEDEE